MSGKSLGSAKGLARVVAAVVAVVLIGAEIAAVSRKSQADRPAEAAAFLIPLSSDIRSTNPGVNRDANTDTVMMHVVEGLVAYREDGTPGPLLARSIQVSADGRTYTFRLRTGVKFHNGAPMTAAEVVWSWRRYLDLKTGWSCRSDFDGSHGAKLVSVEAEDPQTVVFRLDRPEPLFLTRMAAIQCGEGAILHPSSVNPDGSWRWPVGTGPYRLAEWRRGRYIDLAAFPQYASRKGPRDGNTGGKVAYEPRLRWLVIRDAASRLAALAKGQVRAMPEMPAAEMVQARRIPGVMLVSRPMLESYGILVQDRDPLLRDVRIRRALALAIDRHALAGLVTEGAAIPNPSIIPATSPFHTSAEELGGDYDVVRARSLLKAAGYAGQPITLVTNRRYPDMFNQALIVQAMARSAGINIKLEVVEWAAQMDRWESGRFQLMSFGFSAKADPSLSFESILGDRTRDRSKVWDDPAALKLAAAALQTADRSERQADFDRLHALMIDDIPYIALYSPPDVDAVRRGVAGFTPWAFGRARFWGVRRTGAGS